MNRSRILAGAAAGLAAGAVGITTYFEGKSNDAYRDSVNVVTICYGHTATAKMGQVRTDRECETLLQKDLDATTKAVEARVRVPLDKPQKDALVSFTFNVGAGALGRSTLLRKLNLGDYCGAAMEFPKWSYAGGQQLPGLVTRRYAEQTLFMENLSCPR